MGHAQLGAHGAHGGENLATALVTCQALCRAVGRGDGVGHRGVRCVIAHALAAFHPFGPDRSPNSLE